MESKRWTPKRLAAESIDAGRRVFCRLLALTGMGFVFGCGSGSAAPPEGGSDPPPSEPPPSEPPPSEPPPSEPPPPEPPPPEPTGSRVVHVHAPDATDWNGETEFWNHVDATVVDDMVDDGIKSSIYKSRSIGVLLGYTDEQVAALGPGPVMFKVIHPEDIARLTAKAPSRQDEAAWPMVNEYRMRKGDGAWGWFRSESRPFVWGEGAQGSTTLIVTHEVTALREAEAAAGRGEVPASTGRGPRPGSTSCSWSTRSSTGGP